VARLPTPLRPYWPQIKAGTLLATRRVAPITSWISRAIGEQALPRSAVLSGDYAAEAGTSGRLRTVRAAESIVRGTPQGYPARHWAFTPYADFHIDECRLLELRGGHAVRDYGAILSPDGRLIFDLSPYFGVTVPREHPVYWRPCLPPPRRVHGPIAVLAARGSSSYYHFMFDVLPRIQLLRDAGALEARTRYYVSAGRPWQRELLVAYGIQLDRVIDPSVVPHVVGDLLITSLPDAKLLLPPWIVDSVRRQLQTPRQREGNAPFRYLYVGRPGGRHTRRLLNEDELLPALVAAGFQAVRPESLSVADQAKLFSEASVVVGLAGAALTNLIFCREGTRVLELIPPKFVDPVPWAVAANTPGVDFRYLIGKGKELPPGSRMWGVTADFRVDIGRALAMVRELGVAL
jgi:capsular polysaccharide biosynthesis protein